MASDLRELILGEIERRERIARAAVDEVVMGAADWHYDGGFKVIGYDGETCNGEVAEAISDHEAQHIALHDPADALRRYAHYRRVLERHSPVERNDYGNDRWLACVRCGKDVTYRACDPMRDLAEALGLSVEVPDAGQ